MRRIACCTRRQLRPSTRASLVTPLTEDCGNEGPMAGPVKSCAVRNGGLYDAIDPCILLLQIDRRGGDDACTSISSFVAAAAAAGGSSVTRATTYSVTNRRNIASISSADHRPPPPPRKKTRTIRHMHTDRRHSAPAIEVVAAKASGVWRHGCRQQCMRSLLPRPQ